LTQKNQTSDASGSLYAALQQRLLRPTVKTGRFRVSRINRLPWPEAL
jgi:hypothetical protein